MLPAEAVEPCCFPRRTGGARARPDGGREEPGPVHGVGTVTHEGPLGGLQAMKTREEIIPVQLPNGKTAQVVARSLGGEEEIAAGLLPFEDVTEAIEGISHS